MDCFLIPFILFLQAIYVVVDVALVIYYLLSIFAFSESICTRSSSMKVSKS